MVVVPELLLVRERPVLPVEQADLEGPRGLGLMRAAARAFAFEKRN